MHFLWAPDGTHEHQINVSQLARTANRANILSLRLLQLLPPRAPYSRDWSPLLNSALPRIVPKSLREEEVGKD